MAVCRRARQSPERVREGVTLAERAVALDAGNGGIWNTLALAHYRAGDWPGASSAIEHRCGYAAGAMPTIGRSSP